jgi:hypothetical protein
LIFLIYSVYKIFTKREYSYLFYDNIFSYIDETNLIYYKDFEIFFFFQIHGNHMMEKDKNIIRAVIKQTKTTYDNNSSSESKEGRNLSSMKKIRNIQLKDFNIDNNENFNNNNKENFNQKSQNYFNYNEISNNSNNNQNSNNKSNNNNENSKN